MRSTNDHRPPGTLLLVLMLAFGCSGGDATEDAATAGTAESAAEDASAAEEPITDVREIAWAPELGVDLDAMERRPSGLYVQVLEPGDGPPAAPGDTLGVDYTVWLPNGHKLDSSHDHQPPAPLSMVLGETQLIAGWVEGVTGMRRGERRRLVVPYDLAYGQGGRPGVPPYSPLLFEVDLAEHRPASAR